MTWIEAPAMPKKGHSHRYWPTRQSSTLPAMPARRASLIAKQIAVHAPRRRSGPLKKNVAAVSAFERLPSCPTSRCPDLGHMTLHPGTVF